ncbi:hypothetical protein PCANC_00714 [Puccinia coronata f. sp. avenae]|uniref:Uncharacterized protein n=1 Tax=Puccinia coronata f. sp. avenae TaxID=200324 RepID=A0A2N5U6N8_9BASI|nr:hypothetical protein PCASD_17348 [Puccinia coronata f. sp. avenae]PLW58028.1 hypothetical protein PCANC_00714 [Puccinia coronata f. sp. avenae]
MDLERETPSVAETIAAFRGLSTDIIYDEHYQEIYEEVIQQIIRRVNTREEMIASRYNLDKNPTRAPPDDISQTGNEVAKRLAAEILPAFKEKLESFPLVMRPSNFDTPSIGFEAALSQLTEIDEILESIDSSILMIWKAWTPRQDNNPSIHHMSSFKVEKIHDLTRALLTGPFGDLINGCNHFFEEYDLTAVQTPDTRQIDENWNNLLRYAASATDHIDTLIQWIQKPALTMAKAECQKLVVNIDDSLHQICDKIHKSCELETNEDIEILSGIEFDSSLDKVNDLRRDSLPVFKLCRVFFNRISRPTNSQMLIFAKPSIELKSEEMKKFLNAAKRAHGHIFKYTSDLLSSGSDLHSLARVIYKIRSSMVGCWDVLDYYWDSLLASQDPGVDRELVQECWQWLQSWILYFLVATSIAMNATGHSFPEFSANDNSDPDHARFGNNDNNNNNEEEEEEEEEEDDDNDDDDNDDHDDGGSDDDSDDDNNNKSNEDEGNVQMHNGDEEEDELHGEE